MVDRKHRTSRVWGGLCLAALSLATGTPLLAAEAGKAPSVEASVRMPPMELDAQSAEPDFASLGGALYNPFSPAFETAATMPRATPQAPQQRSDGSLGLVTTTVAAFIAAGCLGLLVRLLAAG